MIIQLHTPRRFISSSNRDRYGNVKTVQHQCTYVAPCGGLLYSPSPLPAHDGGSNDTGARWAAIVAVLELLSTTQAADSWAAAVGQYYL